MPAATSKPKASQLSLTGLRAAVAPEPLLAQRFTIRLSRAEFETLQRVATVTGTTMSHAARRILALAAAELLAEQEA